MNEHPLDDKYKAKIFVDNWEGKNNTEEKWRSFRETGLYKNLSTVWLTPTRGTMRTQVAFNWMNIGAGFNQPLAKICIENMEVGEAYNTGLKFILESPVICNFKYLLTVEEDNVAPQDGLQKLYKGIQEYDCVSGLYWTKGEDGVPQIWGDPKEAVNFVPQAVIPETLQRCWGTGMGFALWRLEMFKHPGFKYGSWFKTCTGGEEGCCTQDLYFWTKAAKLGFKCAVDTRIKVGHVDGQGQIW